MVNPAPLDQLLSAAAAAARPLADATGPELAALLDAVAAALEAATGELVALAAKETGLSTTRLTGEVARTAFQLRLYGQEAASGRSRDEQTDEARSDWPPAPRPQLRRINVPIGPVLVFAASNFPFAFSVAGTDTAAALAAGCPVLVKTNPGHPLLSVRTAQIVGQALARAGAPDGTFGVFHSEQDGRTALQDPRIRAAAFTGSLRAGRALYDLAAARPDPIPFYGELGSINPAFVTSLAAARRGPRIWAGFAESYTLGLGQFCTKPGLLFVPQQAAAEAEEAIITAVAGTGATELLSDRIAEGYRTVRDGLAHRPGVRVAHDGGSTGRTTAPTLLVTSADTLRADPDALLTECFGPCALMVTYDGDTQLPALARLLDGQLTATVHGEPDDPHVATLLRELVDRAGRIVWNAWPTGVAVTPAMHHGGPYPATTSPLHTSVGTAALRRFLRPVALQEVPVELLTPAMRPYAQKEDAAV